MFLNIALNLENGTRKASVTMEHWTHRWPTNPCRFQWH